MIFVCLGTREYQFNRLLMKLDELVQDDTITEEVYAQIGSSTYYPKNYNYTKFMEPKVFNQYLESSRLIISHGGTGSIVTALKKGKNVIGVTRLSKYGEHVDNHQKQIVNLFAKENYIYGVEEMDELKNAILFFNTPVTMKKFALESHVIDIIEEFIKANI